MTRVISCIAVLFLFVSAGSVIAGETQQSSKSFKVSKGGLIKISLTTGNIRINTWDKNEVNVRMENMGDADEMNAHQIKIYQSGNTVTVENRGGGGWPNSNDVSVSVPTEFNADLNTNQGNIDIRADLNGTVSVFTGGGDITVKNITGKINFKSYGGGINTNNIGGDADISTNGGDIECGNFSGNAELKTLGGSITVGNVSRNLNASTNGGEITTGEIGGKAEVVTLGGEIDIKKVASSATVKTNGGNIKLSGSNGPVNAVTMGGNIDLYKVSGPVQVKTFAGDIYTELEAVGNSSSKISTLSGNISLYINPSEKATIKCEAKNASYGSGEKAIVSDFNPESYKESQYSGFTDASYNLNGGGQQISLSTLNGGIKIKKLK